MKIHLRTVAVAVVAGCLLGACGAIYARGSKPHAEHPGAMPSAEKKAAMTQSVDVCPDCETMALKAGKCEKCGKEMVQKHVLGTKDGKAMLCDCAAGCKCDAKGMKDGKCACGKDVKTVSCKGMYCCKMGCPEVSDKPGKCACGMEMKKCE
jgi:hypothetical protein